MARAQRSRLISCRRVWAEYGEETAPNGCGVAADTGLPTEFGLAKGVESDVRAPWLRYWGRGADLLIFEDLSSALDVATERQSWESLGRSKDGTCLAVSHRRPALGDAAALGCGKRRRSK